jgi:pSer/pThr/pTyr-binding forkhead associated (FHA) protein
MPPASLVQVFVIKIKGIKKSKEVALAPGGKVTTIGRDKANSLVIEDSRVSRSHARVDYSDTRQ